MSAPGRFTHRWERGSVPQVHSAADTRVLKETAFWRPEDIRYGHRRMREPSVQPRQMFCERLPAPNAASHVSCTWIQRIPAGMPAYLHRTVPNGCVELTYEVGAQDLAVLGARRSPIVDVLVPGATGVGVRAHPGAAPEVLGVRAFALSGRTVYRAG